MCGIYGEVSLNQTIDHLRINKNLQLLDHRGPDDEGIWINDDRKIAFGFKRLSIIDLSKRGNQPMIDSSNNYVIIFNEKTPLSIIKKIKPDLITKGGDYKNKKIVGENQIKKWGGEILTLDYIRDLSSTNILDKLKV